MNRFARTTLAAHIYLGTAMSGAAHAGFTGSVTVDPFTTAVSIVPNGGESTFFETSLTGGPFNRVRYALHHPDLAPESPGFSTLSMETIASAGRLVTHSSGAPTSAFAYQWHELTYSNADGSALDLSGLVSFSHSLAISGSLHGTTFHLMVESESQGVASAWGAFSNGTWAVTTLRDEFSWQSEPSWNDIHTLTFRWGLFGPNSYGITREISNLNANFIPAPGAMALIAASCALGARRRRR